MSIAWKKINEDRKKEKVQLGVKFIVHMLLVVVAYSLRNKYNFGYHRIWRVVNYINLTFDDVYYGRINLKDLEQVLKEECDVVIK